MPNVLREHGFVFLIAILLVAFIAYFIYDGNKYNVDQKKDDGKDVVMSIDTGAVTADALYEKMLSNNGILLYNIYRNEVINQTIKTTEKMEEKAKQLESNILATAKQSDAENYESIIVNELATYGFKSMDDLSAYCLISVKEKSMNEKYVDAHFDEVSPALNEKHPRTISIVTMEVSNPDELTEAEQKKKDDINSSIESQGFAKTATAFSEDYTAQDKGVYGYIDDDDASNAKDLPVEVINAALELEQDGTSDWISVLDQSTGKYTMYLVHVDQTDVNEMHKSKNETIKDQLLYAILNNNQGLSTKILQEQAKDIKVEFANEELQKLLDDSIQAQSAQEETEEVE